MLESDIELLKMIWNQRGTFVMTTFSFDMKQAIANRLANLADRRAISTVQMLELAVEEFVDREEWRLAEIDAAIAEANSGDFASDDEMAAMLRRFALPLPAK